MFAVTFVIAGAALVVIALVISIISLRQRDRRLQARAIKRLGFGVIAVFSLLAGLFIAGEAFEEPGGIGAISLVLAWLIPLVGVAGVAWFRPRLATPIMIALSGVVVLASLWFAVDPDAWRVIEDQYGPVRAVAVFVLSAAVGVLGLKKDRHRRLASGRSWCAPDRSLKSGQRRRDGLTFDRQRYPADHRHPLPGLSKAGSSLGLGVTADSGGILSDSLSDPTAHRCGRK